MPGQSRESVNELRRAIRHISLDIDRYCMVDQQFGKHPLLVGPAGAGKTHIMLLAATYALSKGLKVAMLALTSDRARAVGGEHIHLFFKINVSNRRLQSADFSVEETMIRLARDPVRLAMVKRIDVIFIEEIGLLSAQTLYVIDMVLRTVRGCQAPYGNCLIFGSGDCRQLPPVRGEMFWTSSGLITDFSVIVLKHFVRSRGDVDLQELINILVMPIAMSSRCNAFWK